MTNDKIALRELLENGSDTTFLREMIAFAAERLMALETETLCGAGPGEHSAGRTNQRKLLIATQATMGAPVLALGVLTVTGIVRLWHVYVFAFLFGSAAAFDAPVRHTFVAELVGDEDLHNAVALNSTSFNAARMIGPAVSGMERLGSVCCWPARRSSESTGRSPLSRRAIGSLLESLSSSAWRR